MTAEPKHNVYRCNTMVGNWVEERAIRDQVIEIYLKEKEKGDLKAAQLEAEYNNLMAPEPLSDGKIVFPNDKLLVVVHCNIPMSLSVDPRYSHIDYPDACVTSLSEEISNGRRHVFQVVRVKPFTFVKAGNVTNSTNIQKTTRPDKVTRTSFADCQKDSEKPLCYGDRFVLVANQSMMGSTRDGKLEAVEWVVGCPRTTTAGDPPLVLGKLYDLSDNAEWVAEPYQMSERQMKLGQAIMYHAPIVLRQCLTGQCLGCHADGPVGMKLDLRTPEYRALCKSQLNSHRHEG